MIAISMRMTEHVYPGGTRERRDALAHDWWRFLRQALPHVPILPVPNIGEQAVAFVQQFPVVGIVLTGGDDWGVFPERDDTEERLFLWAERMSLPVVGVCRGAQVLNRIMGGGVSANFSEKHAGTRHTIRIKRTGAAPAVRSSSLEVNSYHALGLWEADLARALEPWAIAEDGSIEAFSGDTGRVTGIMWHPEREHAAREHDIHLFQQCLTGVKL